jgi:hypothetical protein
MGYLKFNEIHTPTHTHIFELFIVMTVTMMQ